MAKRKKRSKPNIPQATLARARQQAAGTLDDVAADDGSESPTTTPPAESTPAVRRQSPVTPAQLRRNAGKDKPLTGEELAERLAHPTKVVSEEELHAEYGFVLADLRSMGILAAALMVLLVVLAQIL